MFHKTYSLSLINFTNGGLLCHDVDILLVIFFVTQVRLNKNYRSTRCIVEAASFVIQNNIKRCQLKSVLTDNVSGSKVLFKHILHARKLIFFNEFSLFAVVSI